MTEAEDTKADQKSVEVENDEKPAAENDNDEKKENGRVEDDDDGNESSEGELGSLEKPVEILSRKRDRKSTERFSLDSANEAKKTPEDDLDYTTGKGVKLGDIEFVRYSLDKTHSDDLKPLHRLLYHKVAKANMVKKNIRAFCGFPFEKDSTPYQRMQGTMERFVTPGLRFICGLLGLEKGGDKEQLKERLLNFLMKPEDLEKPIPKPKQKKKKSKDKKKSKSKKEKSASSSETVEVSSADESGDEGNDDEEKVEEKPKEKKKKSESPKKKAANKDKKKPTPVKISAPKKKKKDRKDEPKKKKADSKRKVVEDSEDDEPLVKKTKSEPTDAELRKVVEGILKDANLEEVTMKTVCRQVYDTYPDFDLTARKDFIKTTVKEIIS